MRYNDENQMTVGPYYPDPPKPERDPDQEREFEPTEWAESSVRMCLKCHRSARLFDGEHRDCPIKKEVQSVTNYPILKGAHNG